MPEKVDVVTIPIEVKCPRCERKHGIAFPLEWFTSKVMIADVQLKLDAILAKMAIVKALPPVEKPPEKPRPASKSIGTPNGPGKGIAHGSHVERFVCKPCYAGTEYTLPHEIFYQEDSPWHARNCADCGETTLGRELVKLVWHA